MHVFRGEWCVTGDMLQRNADGTFSYCGRSDDLLKVHGRWLAPAEVDRSAAPSFTPNGQKAQRPVRRKSDGLKVIALMRTINRLNGIAMPA